MKNVIRISTLRRCPTSSHLDPLRETAALFTFDIDDISVTLAPTANTILLDRVRSSPVFIFFNPLFLIFRCLLQVRNAGKLSCRGIGGTMLDGGMSVSKVAEIVDVARGEKRTGGKRVDRGVTPL